ncbi:MAG: caspase family protein [Gammaproteobacteria bacterium]|nr:caspase family protein [Gammaproteobacteria bacterium]
MSVTYKCKLSEIFLYIAITAFVFLSLSSYVHARSFGGQLSSQISNSIKKQVRAAIVPTLTTKKNKIEYPKIMRISKDNRYLALTMEGGYISIWDMERGEEIDNIPLKSMTLKDFSIDYNQKKIYLIDTKGILYSKPLVEGKLLSKMPQIQKNYRFDLIRVNAELMTLSTSKNELLIFGKDNQTKLLAKINLKSQINSIDLIDKMNQLLVSTNDQKLSLYNYSKTKNNAALIKTWRLNYKPVRVFFNKNGTALAVHLKNAQYAYASKDKDKFSPIQYEKKSVLLLDFSGDELNVLTNENIIFKQNVNTGQVLKSKKINLSASDLNSNQVQFYQNGQYLLFPKRQGGIFLVDINQDKKIAQLVSTKSGWAILDKKGRYDGNEDAFHDVSWDADGKLIELDQFSEKYFEPGLLQKIVRKKQKMITEPIVEIEKGVYLPPDVSVKIVTKEESFRLPGSIELNITAKIDGSFELLHDIKIFHNGKKIPNSKINLKKSIQKGNYGIKEWNLKVSAVEGLNGFNVEVKGWENVEGQSQQVIFTAKKLVTPKSKHMPKRMFMKSIGINDYQGKELDLDFAVPDAREIFKTFSGSTLLMSNSNQDAHVKTLMLNKQASKKAILSLLDKTQLESNKNDMLVVFMSGHGIVVDNNWYFLPQEARTLHDTQHLKAIGLSAKELMEKFVGIPSQKIVLIIDACQSGAVTEDFNNFHQRRALKGLSKSTGIHIIAATRADQLAPEFGELGHGLFTYTLLNGMKKNSQGSYNADQWPKDGKLMVSELQQYAEKFVPALAHAMASRNYASSGERGGVDERTIVTPVGSSQGYDFIIYQ